MSADSTPSWLGAAVTAAVAGITGLVALMRHFFVTHRDVERYLEKSEKKFETKVDEVKDVLLNLHADNRDARHRMRNDINAPLTTLAANFEALRQELVLQRRDDVQRRARKEDKAREESERRNDP